MKKSFFLLLLAVILGGCTVYVFRPELELLVNPEEAEAPALIHVQLQASPTPQSCQLSCQGQVISGQEALFYLETSGRHEILASGLDWKGRPFTLTKEVFIYELPEITTLEAQGEDLLYEVHVAAQGKTCEIVQLSIDPGLGYAIVVQTSGLQVEATVPVLFPQTGSYTIVARALNTLGKEAQAELPVVVEIQEQPPPEI